MACEVHYAGGCHSGSVCMHGFHGDVYQARDHGHLIQRREEYIILYPLLDFDTSDL